MEINREDSANGVIKQWRVVYCHDHDEARRQALEAEGGHVVGWVGGYYRMLVKQVAGGDA